jgi:hypothetical protein
MPNEAPETPEEPGASEALDRDLEQMSGSPALAKQVKESLRRLADGAAGPKLAEMARDVLDGRTDLRTVARSSVYADNLTEAIGQFQRWQAQLTPEERERFLGQARQELLGHDQAQTEQTATSVVIGRSAE